jgi:hypothetical protein
MSTLTWKDGRLPADDIAPWDTTVMFVGSKIPLAELVTDSVKWCEANAGAKNLMIYCHGSPGYLQICTEGITVNNLNVLTPLKPYFDQVSIHACLIAKGTTGKTFCTKLAGVLVAWVAGAVELQYNTGIQTLYGSVDDRKYDGEYYIHKPSGERTGPLRSK